LFTNKKAHFYVVPPYDRLLRNHRSNLRIMPGFIELFNPLHYVSSAKWTIIWQHLFHTVFLGAGAKILSGVSLIVAFWFIARKDNLGGFIGFLLIAIFFAYFGGILNVF